MLRPKAGILPLEAIAERAGAALACPFASSAEYEADIIRAQRAAGVYGPKRQRRQIAGFAAATVLIALLIWLV
jgi:hypothetical protein